MDGESDRESMVVAAVQPGGAGRPGSARFARGADQDLPIPHARGQESALKTDARSWWRAGFTVVRRGYDPQEVEAAFDRAEADYTMAVTDRDELARAGVRARAEIAELQREAENLAAGPITAEHLSGRMQRMLKLAEDEATEIRAKAVAAAHGVVAQARIQARALVDEAAEKARRLHESSEVEARRRGAEAEDHAAATVLEAERQAAKLQREAREALVEADRMRESAEVEARELRTEIRAEVDRLRQEAEAERTRLDETSHARRTQAEQDFESALRTRRETANAALDAAEEHRRRVLQACHDAEAEAAARVAAATAETDELARHRDHVARRLHALREAIDDAPLTSTPNATTASATPSARLEPTATA